MKVIVISSFLKDKKIKSLRNETRLQTLLLLKPSPPHHSDMFMKFLGPQTIHLFPLKFKKFNTTYDHMAILWKVGTWKLLLCCMFSPGMSVRLQHSPASPLCKVMFYAGSAGLCMCLTVFCASHFHKCFHRFSPLIRVGLFIQALFVLNLTGEQHGHLGQNTVTKAQVL